MRLILTSVCFPALLRAGIGLPLLFVACQIPNPQVDSPINSDELERMRSTFSDELERKYIILEEQRNRFRIEESVPWRSGVLLLGKYSPVGYHPDDRRVVGFWDGESIDCRATDYLNRDIELDGTVQGL